LNTLTTQQQTFAEAKSIFITNKTATIIENIVLFDVSAYASSGINEMRQLKEK